MITQRSMNEGNDPTAGFSFLIERRTIATMSESQRLSDRCMCVCVRERADVETNNQTLYQNMWSAFVISSNMNPNGNHDLVIAVT